ncbi:MAG: Gfo/Idh/MocA family oxidoreductase, partial [Planctomycetes bacterium]|nr:Gfo/Idh/MocA family oxidoreductase [Planctomycetota bacterium]
RGTRNADDLLSDDGIDAVAIATPVATHFDLARRALERGKHVWVEKPLTRSVKEAAALVALAEKHRRVLMVDHTYLYSAPVRTLREMVTGGSLGKVLYANSTRVNLGLFQKDINVVWDLAPHDLSIMNFLLGARPERVSVEGSRNVNPAIEDVAFVTLRYPGGALFHLHVSWLDPCKIRRITIVGDKQMAVYDDLDSAEPIRVYDKGVEKLPYLHSYGEFRMFYRIGNMVAPRIEMHEPLRAACGAFLGAIQGGKPTASDGRAGAALVAVLEAAQASVERGGASVPVDYAGL